MSLAYPVSNNIHRSANSASLMAAIGGVTIFQEARDRIKSDITNIIQCLNNRQVEMFKEIASLEKEFKDKQQQKFTDLNKLNSMKARTEEELGENSLIEVQQKVIRDLQEGIDKLTLQMESTREPDYTIEIIWGTSLLSSIFDSEISIIDSEINIIDISQENTSVPKVTPRGVNSKKRSRNRRNRGKSVNRDEDSATECHLSARDTREFANRGGIDYYDSNRRFSNRGRWYAAERGHYTDDGNW